MDSHITATRPMSSNLNSHIWSIGAVGICPSNTELPYQYRTIKTSNIVESCVMGCKHAAKDSIPLSGCPPTKSLQAIFQADADLSYAPKSVTHISERLLLMSLVNTPLRAGLDNMCILCTLCTDL